MNYANRQQAGQVLADLLHDYAVKDNSIILGLPRGGVPVAYEIATKLSLPMDIFIVRKLGVPGHEEYAMGAIAPGGVVVFNEDVVHGLHIDRSAIDEVLRKEKLELERRDKVYRVNKSPLHLMGKTIILVDDGIATGYTMRAAIAALKQKNPAELIVAVPVAARSTCAEMASLVNKIICPLQPANFYAVGLWYDDFSQTSDEEVMRLMTTLSSTH
ncbi:phosphoribosyltransferase [Legionella lytica]|uniref:Phosphoribosyltransferase n=1 Tax=Legionella lytica TaxID=96232 RepID=A0ABY4Y902_9GAMM|nr:phosphoribosyltransferase [Legionella lytica]USQ13996.1 phosphoribosyltransferase [Legionella lytica]